MFSCSRSGIGGSTAAGQPCARSARSLVAGVSFFRRCNSRKASAEDSSARDGVRILWTISSSRSLRALLLVQPTHGYSRADSGFHLAQQCDFADLESGGSNLVEKLRVEG